MERLPNPFSLRGGYPWPFVLDPDPRRAVVAAAFESHGNRLTRGSVLHGVIEQIDEHLAHRAAIDFGHDVVVDAHADLHPPGAGERSERFEHFTHERRELRLFGHERILTTLDA